MNNTIIFSLVGCVIGLFMDNKKISEKVISPVVEEVVEEVVE